MKAEKSPVKFLFGVYLDEITEGDKIKKAKKTSELKGVNDKDMEKFKDEVEAEKKNVNKIKSYSETKSKEETGSTDEEKESNKQFWLDLGAAMDVYLSHIENYEDLIKVISKATSYIENGRVDLARMYLAKSRYHGAKIKYESHLVARDVMYWY